MTFYDDILEPSTHRCVCVCALQGHEYMDISSTVTPLQQSQVVHTVHTVGLCGEPFCCSLLEKTTQIYTTQHTWASSFTDSQHQVRKEMLFHGKFSFCHKSVGNSGLCCGLTRRNSQTPQMRLHLRAKERELYYYYDCKSEWMNGTSSCPHITFPVFCLTRV